jgi:hypothetical protein
MSWQEELQQLDSELAQGRVTPEDYRLRRDQLLGLAQQGQQQAAPQPAQQQSSPFGAPFRWQPPQQQGQQAPPQSPTESTQVLRPITDQTPPPSDDSAERTQVVRGTDAGSADRTQVVPNTGGFTPSPQTPSPWAAMPQQPMQVPQGNSEFGQAPWGNDLPADFGKATWPRQGPEVFDSTSGGGKTGKIIAIVVAVVVVLGLAGGIYFFAGGSGKNNNATTTQSTSKAPTTTTSAPPPLPAGPFVQVPGKQVLNTSSPIDAAVTNKIPTPDEAKLFKTNGVIQVAGVVTQSDDLHQGVWAFQTGTGVDPKVVLNAIDAFYASAKYQQVTTGIPQGVIARTLAADGPNGQATFRAHYISNGYVIRAEAYSPDAAAAEKAFRALLSSETAKFPPTS